MIDVQTVKFIGLLNGLAKASAHGIRPFSAATVQDKRRLDRGLWYDDKNLIKIDKNGYFDYSCYPLVHYSRIDDQHHDVVATWTEEYDPAGIQIIVKTNDYHNFISITFANDPSFYITIENGVWYAV